MSGFTKLHVTVCIITYRRVVGLSRLLRSLAIQVTEGRFSFSVVVIDNDSSGEAKEIVDRFTSESGIQSRFQVSPVNSIPVARNLAVDLAEGDYIAIVDDDEFVPSRWLLHLLEATESFEVQGALGPVHPYFEKQPPRWIERGNFCERPVLRTGTRLRWQETRSGNVLVARRLFVEDGIRFDEGYSTGGSDKDFFRRAMAKGYSFVAVEEAPVYEIVSNDRCTESYWLRRALVNGYNAHKNDTHRTSLFRSLLLFIKCLLALGFYVLATPVCMLMGKHRLIQCGERGAHHLSRLCAMMGFEVLKRRNF